MFRVGIILLNDGSFLIILEVIEMSKAMTVCEECGKTGIPFCPICENILNYDSKQNGICYHCKGVDWKIDKIPECPCGSIKHHFIKTTST